jgi:hypothetical protein
MIHEARQNFIHDQAKKLKDKLGVDLKTPEMFNIIKGIITDYDAAKEKTGWLPPKRPVKMEGHNDGCTCDECRLLKCIFEPLKRRN